MADETKPKAGSGGVIPPEHARFKPGQSGNPGGKPAGTRNRLSGSFINALADDFERYGRFAIARTRRKDPASYVRALVALQPKEVELKRPLDELDDAELITAVRTLQSFLAAKEAATGDGSSAEPSQTH